jgi:hypothetical protein
VISKSGSGLNVRGQAELSMSNARAGERPVGRSRRNWLLRRNGCALLEPPSYVLNGVRGSLVFDLCQSMSRLTPMGFLFLCD